MVTAAALASAPPGPTLCTGRARSGRSATSPASHPPGARGWDRGAPLRRFCLRKKVRTSRPKTHQGPPKLGALLSTVARIAADEGFTVHPEKTRIAKRGARQRVTGLVVNDAHGPRVPRTLRRRVRAMIHNLARGKPLREGETLGQLAGQIAFIHMTDPALGKRLAAQLSAIDG